jgi:hypothetical protein
MQILAGLLAYSVFEPPSHPLPEQWRYQLPKNFLAELTAAGLLRIFT